MELNVDEPAVNTNDNVLKSAAVVAFTNKTDKPKRKNKPSKIVGIIPCSTCDKEFINNDILIKHEKNKHKVGKLVEISSPEPIDDSNDHSQPSDHDNPKHIDLIAFTDDDDDYDPPQSNVLTTTTTETSRPVAVSDDDSNTSGSSSESNDRVWLESNSPNNEKPTEVDVPKHTEEDD